MVNIDNLFKLIALKGINQSKLAEDTSISTGNISDWKKGKSMPSAVKLDELASYFGCSVDYLLGRTDTPTGTGNINQSNIAITGDNNANVNTPAHHQDSTSQQLVEIFEKLSLEDKMKIINSVIELKNKEEYKISIKSIDKSV